MKPYYQDEWVTQYCSDALTVLRGLESDSLDLLCTDPPYGISFMGKDWDKALPDIEVWRECLRVMKPGAFAFVMSIPRSDCLSRMIIAVESAGFAVNFTPIYWAYASGFPKAQNIGKAVDKRLGAEREVTGESPYNKRRPNPPISELYKQAGYKANITIPATPQAKALDGSYGGFQPKPAVEVIIVAMKPLSEKTFVDQALKNQKGITWLDDCRVPYDSNDNAYENGIKRAEQPRNDIRGGNFHVGEHDNHVVASGMSPSGRFPANLLVSDDVLDDEKNHNKGGSIRSAGMRRNQVYGEDKRPRGDWNSYGDSGSFSRYFDLDKWWVKTFPFFIVPKASKGEKNKGIGVEVPRTKHGSTPRKSETVNKSPNNHPTVKPLKLMSYLITLGSRQGDTVLDPFGGSGTTALAAKLLNRRCIISEIEEKYCEIAVKRYSQSVMRLEV